MKLVLASRSPRRAELLTAAAVAFTVRAADVDETPLDGERPADYVVRVARDKALAIPREPGEVVLAADTTVVLDSELMRHERVNFHPLVNTRTTGLASADLLKFLRATGHEPLLVSLGAGDVE